MLKQKMWLLLTLLLILGFLISQPSGNKILGASSTITVNLTETPQAFKNPMKGFRPSRYHQDSGFTDREYSTIYKHYIAYSLLESTASDSVQKIKDWSNSAWAGIERRNIKVIPRVFILYPGTGEFWGDIPHDGTPSQWTTDVLKNRLVAFAAKLGQAWDNDPRVAAVEMGLWGKWGEHNIWPDIVPGTSSDRIPESFQSALGAAFTNAFHNKKVMVRYENSFTNFNFGYIWDSFALPNDLAWANFIMARDTWKTQMISGEVAYDWGDQSQLGGSPNGTLSSNSNTDYVISWIQKTHCSSLGWIAEYTPDGGTISANAARMQKAFGYRFVINQATFSSRADQGGTLSLSFKVTNVGNAPFYYNWPVQVGLLKSDRSVAWSGTFNTDIRQWLPGSTYTISGDFTIPTNLASGTYTLALAVLDPAGNQPSLRFANTNYYTGGRTPIGKVGVGQDPSDQNLGSFNDLKNDNTLSYSLNNGPNPTPTPSNTPTPVVTPTPTPSGGMVYYEAEAAANTLSGTTIRINDANCSNGQKVGYLGNGSNNYLLFNGIHVASNGSYQLKIFYLSAESRTFYISVNGGSGPSVVCNSSGGWNTVGSVTTNVNLNAGSNTIKFYNNNAYCPDLDRIGLAGGLTTPTPTPTTIPSPTPTPNVGNLILDNFDGIPVWPGGNDLGNWAGANSFINNAGVINNNALVLQYNNAGWFGSDVNRNLSPYQYLVFRIKGATGGEQNAFKLRIGTAYKMFSEFTATPITTGYQDIRIDMIANGINRSSPGQLNMEFWFGKNGTIYIDEIRFE